MTGDGRIRHAPRADGRYDEARGSRRSAHQDRYTVTGNHIDDVDDTGLSADAGFVDGVLHHAGRVLHRVPAAASTRLSGSLLPFTSPRTGDPP